MTASNDVSNQKQSLKQLMREKYLKNEPTACVDPSAFRVLGCYKYRGMVMANFTPEHRLQQVEQLNFEKDDIVLSSYPKTGTTITQEMVYLVRNGGDVDEANKEYTFLRIPYLEFEGPSAGIDAYHERRRPRTIKSHLPVDCFERQVTSDGTRFIYVMRNPKDTLVSYYHFYKSCYLYGGFFGTFNDFFQMFLCNNVCYGNMFDHFLGWWRHRDLPNVLILKYEDLVRHPEEEIRKIAGFCKKELDDAAIERIVQATSFDVMKANPKTNNADTPFIDESISPFIRKGHIGDWKNYFTAEQNEQIDSMIAERLQADKLNFDYE
ncbi:sulfotransferase 1C2-like [Lineus longissimus]|uniref:sulfotransferase 1C2-like n=1 Tax=Lineus longissimus TaxID=88925 RepID=UPI002B4C8636